MDLAIKNQVLNVNKIIKFDKHVYEILICVDLPSISIEDQEQYIHDLLYSLSDIFEIDRKWINYDNNNISMYFRNKNHTLIYCSTSNNNIY
jgi:hypothetical protein